MVADKEEQSRNSKPTITILALAPGEDDKDNDKKDNNGGDSSSVNSSSSRGTREALCHIPHILLPRYEYASTTVL